MPKKRDSAEDADIDWRGDSLDVISWPDKVKETMGLDIRRVQRGELPVDGKPLTDIGQGVFELREEFKKRSTSRRLSAT
jgi:phage-related protein